MFLRLLRLLLPRRRRRRRRQKRCVGLSKFQIINGAPFDCRKKERKKIQKYYVAVGQRCQKCTKVSRRIKPRKEECASSYTSIYIYILQLLCYLPIRMYSHLAYKFPIAYVHCTSLHETHASATGATGTKSNFRGGRPKFIAINSLSFFSSENPNDS